MQPWILHLKRRKSPRTWGRKSPRTWGRPLANAHPTRSLDLEEEGLRSSQSFAKSSAGVLVFTTQTPNAESLNI